MAGESAGDMARRQREKAERLNRSADRWERGAHGEQATARALAMLPTTWRVVHDVRWPGRRYANIDHIAVGPGGVFVIDSKAWSGSVSVDGQVLRQNGYKREREVAAAADAAIAVAERAGLSPDLVHPVLCLVNEEPLTVCVRDVIVCTTATLVPFLSATPVVFDSRMVASQTAALAGMPSAAPVGRSYRPRPRSSRPGPRSYRPTRRPNVGLGGLLKAFVLFALLVVALQVVPKAASNFAAHLPTTPSGSLGSATSTAPSRLGARLRLPPATNRPPLLVTADKFVTTRSRDPHYYVVDGNRVVAVRITIRNLGKRTWVSQPGTTASFTTSFAHPAYAGVAVSAGRALPSLVRLRPGHLIRGFVVTQVAQTDPVTEVELTVGPGQPAIARWSVDRQ